MPLTFPAGLFISFKTSCVFLIKRHFIAFHPRLQTCTLYFFKSLTCTDTSLPDKNHHHDKIASCSYIVMLPYTVFFFFLSQVQNSTFFSAGCCSVLHQAGFKGQVLSGGRALCTGQTGLGLWSVGFVLWAAAQVVIHLKQKDAQFS